MSNNYKDMFNFIPNSSPNGTDDIASFDALMAQSGKITSEDQSKNLPEATRQELDRAYAKLHDLENIIRQSPAVIFVWKAQQGLPVEYVSENVLQFGYSPEDFYSGNLNYDQIIFKEDLKRVHTEIATYRRKKHKDFKQTYRIKTKSGDIRWIDVHKWIKRDKSGNVINYQGIVIDITERKTAEEAIGERDEFLQEILRSLDEHIAVLDENGNIILVNEAWERFTIENGGYYHLGKTSVGNNYLEICRRVINEGHGCAVEEAKRALIGIQMVLERSVPRFSMEYECSSPDEERWFLMNVTPLATSLRGAVVTHIDITRRKKTEVAIKKSQQQLNLLNSAIEQSTEIVVITDPQGKIQYANSAFKNVTGYDIKYLIGKKPKILKSGKHDDDFYKNMWTTITNKKVWTGHLINRKADGELYEEDAVIFPVIDSEGKITNFAKIARDVTDKVRLEKQLLMAQKMEAVGRLAGGIAHDFNNLLAGIKGFAELAILESSENPYIREYLLEINKAADKDADLVRQLLTFSRKQMTSPKIVNLNDIINEFSRMIRRVLIENIELVIDIDPEIKRVEIDPGQVEQILMNLAINAKDAMPNGGRLVIGTRMANLDEDFCREHPYISPGEYVELFVCDTGIGLDEETISHIFEPLFTTKERGKGTGLGLSSVYGIVKQVGGYILVKSELEKGSEFHIFFNPTSQKASFIAEESRIERILVGGSETILVVDDEKIVRTILSQVLEKMGYDVHTASSGHEGLLLAEKLSDKLKLLIADIVLPDMNGADFSLIVEKKLPQVKTLLMSGYVDRPKNIQELDRKFEFIGKPFKVEDLLKKIREMLNN